jgi:hypothetical protein
VQKPRRLITFLWASTPSCRDSLTFCTHNQSQARLTSVPPSPGSLPEYIHPLCTAARMDGFQSYAAVAREPSHQSRRPMEEPETVRPGVSSASASSHLRHSLWSDVAFIFSVTSVAADFSEAFAMMCQTPRCHTAAAVFIVTNQRTQILTFMCIIEALCFYFALECKCLD